MTRLKAVSLMVAACALFTLQGRADTTYYYTGNSFNQFDGGTSCPSTCGISGSFTVGNPLAPNFSGYFVPTAFSFTDGTVTITPANSTHLRLRGHDGLSRQNHSLEYGVHCRCNDYDHRDRNFPVVSK